MGLTSALKNIEIVSDFGSELTYYYCHVVYFSQLLASESRRQLPEVNIIRFFCVCVLFYTLVNVLFSRFFFSVLREWVTLAKPQNEFPPVFCSVSYIIHVREELTIRVRWGQVGLPYVFLMHGLLKHESQQEIFTCNKYFRIKPFMSWQNVREFYVLPRCCRMKVNCVPARRKLRTFCL